ncbi:hypothetical protein Cadr_000014028, partial [Camelus dromedarius]
LGRSAATDGSIPFLPRNLGGEERRLEFQARGYPHSEGSEAQPHRSGVGSRSPRVSPPPPTPAQLASFFPIVTDYTSKPSLKFYHLANVNVGYKSKVVSRSAQINHNHRETSALLMVLQQHHLSTYIRNYDFMIKLLLLLEGVEYKS